jgi:putative transposase
MLSPEELSSWYERLRLSAQTRRLIDSIRSCQPARRVQARRLNVCGRYPSRKMGVTIQFESHRVELAAIYEMEHDAEVFEYYDQPPPLKLNYRSASGRLLGVIHTPDFFAIRTACAGWEECKTEEDLLQLTAHNPNRYCRDAQGVWRCPPGEAQATPWGLYYRVRSSSQVDGVFQRNIQFLEDYLRADPVVIEHRVREAVLTVVSAHPGISLDALFHATEQAASADDIYLLIASGAVSTDLSAAPLIDPQHVFLFQNGDPQALWQRTESAQRDIPDVKVIAAAQELSQLPTMGPDQIAEANRRLQIVRAYQASEPIAGDVSPRTIRDWMQKYRRAEALYGTGYLGLMSRWRESGNRTPRLPEKTRDLMAQFIEVDYESLKQKRRLHVYGALLRACESHGTPAPSYKTFCQEVSRRPMYEQLLKRKGRRAAYKAEPTYFEPNIMTPRHGDRPFHICHIDHTELDIELLCSNTGRNLGRPWLTLLIDAFSRRLLAVALAFDPPSYRACMIVLRECVRRHNRLPQIVVVDGGKEFESVYFETLLARYECTKKTRPPAKARFGSVCERIFGTTNTQLIYNLAGNTQITKEVRVVTSSVNPRHHAVWTLGRLYDRLFEWAYEIYDTTEHPALGQTPRDCFADGLARAGSRVHRAIAYDDEFRIMTLPTTTKGTAWVSPGRGVKIHHLHYWSSIFRDPAVEQTSIPVRYDPHDAGTAYAYVGKRWVTCFSEHYAAFRGRSEREMMIATAELRKRLHDHSSNTQLTARKLADFISSIEDEEVLLLQRLRDAESRHVPEIGHKCHVAPQGDPCPTADERRSTEMPAEPCGPLAPPQPQIFEEY